MNVENLYDYNVLQYTIVAHVLTLGYAAMAAGFVYFLVTRQTALPRYQLSSILSAVVMVSAFLQLFVLSDQWQRSFAWNGVAFEQTGTLFSNGFRYMNWSIDVPVLLTQLLIVLGVTGTAFRRNWFLFTVGGLGMIYTGYAGQFYEADASVPFYAWGTVSTVFFFFLLVLVYRVVYSNLERLPQEARPLAKGVWWLLLVSWFLYPGAYLMPVLWSGADGIVARQITYTVADVVSKVIYGVLLSIIALKVSKHEGSQEAFEADPAVPRGGITGEPTGVR